MQWTRCRQSSWYHCGICHGIPTNWVLAFIPYIVSNSKENKGILQLSHGSILYSFCTNCSIIDVIESFKYYFNYVVLGPWCPPSVRFSEVVLKNTSYTRNILNTAWETPLKTVCGDENVDDHNHGSQNINDRYCTHKGNFVNGTLSWRHTLWELCNSVTSRS